MEIKSHLDSQVILLDARYHENSFLDIVHVASHKITVQHVTARKTYVLYVCLYIYCVRAGLYDAFCSPVTYLIMEKV